jgi:sigma-B regulation protein RsbU (phosphoserine phosphatase)
VSSISRRSQDIVVKAASEPTGPRVERARAMLGAADLRDARAHDRDLAALARDEAASARDGAEGPARAVRRRALAAEQRALAAADRLVAKRDRQQAAWDRMRSLVDREMLAAGLAAEERLRNAALGHQRRAEELARTLQRSLSPPSLPSIAGLDVAVHYEPSAPEEVGGDFYDLFPFAAGRLGFFLGDVCGKGPEAAAVTSLVRYTMRTAAMIHEDPGAILMDLNAALLTYGDGSMQTCTTVYGQIDVTSGVAAVTLAVAGHPPPVIVRANGGVEVTTAHGTMLGAVGDPSFDTCEICLDLGDAIVMCSDGLLETGLGGARVDEQHLAQLLAGLSQANAQGLVNRLTEALSEVERPLRDDVAIMALRRA